MESPSEKRGEQRQELPELQIVPLERRPGVDKRKMPPGIVNTDISKVVEKQRQIDEEKRKKAPHLDS